MKSDVFTNLLKKYLELKETSQIDEKISLEYHDKLNERLWATENDIKPTVKTRLLSIGKAFQKFCAIPQSCVIDIQFAGGNANYNFSPISDIDVHIVVDYVKLSKLLNKSVSELDTLYRTKKHDWTIRHSAPQDYVEGYPVELYVQDRLELIPKGQGVYSLLYGHWFKKPENLHLNFTSDASLNRKIDYMKHSINLALSSGSQAQIQKIKDKLKNMRTAGLHRNGEFDHKNLVFKEIRNEGFFDMINNSLNNFPDTAPHS